MPTTDIRDLCTPPSSFRPVRFLIDNVAANHCHQCTDVADSNLFHSYRRTGNLRAAQLLLGHTRIESTVRYLGVEVDDALEIAEKISLVYLGRAVVLCPAALQGKRVPHEET